MSSPDQDPQEAIAAPDEEVIDVRRGMFGVRGTGDTSGYGRLVHEVTLPLWRIHRAIGNRLTCICVDNGVLRLDEANQIAAAAATIAVKQVLDGVHQKTRLVVGV